MEENKYKSKTIEMLEKKSDPLSTDKYASFKEELQKDIDTLRAEKEKTGNKKSRWSRKCLLICQIKKTRPQGKVF